MARIAVSTYPRRSGWVISLMYITGSAAPLRRDRESRQHQRERGKDLSEERWSLRPDHRPHGSSKEILIEGDLRRE